MNTRESDTNKYRQWFGALSDEQLWRLRSEWPSVYKECIAGNFEKCRDILELCVLTTSYYSIQKLTAF